jgi:hypothetical protein
MGLYELVATAPVLPVDLPLDVIELPGGGGESRFEARDLGVDVVKENPPLGDHHPNIHEVRGSDRDPPGRPGPAKASHRAKHALSAGGRQGSSLAA